MLLFFLKILNQKPGAYVCVQLLQTLNILFENIRHETSLCKSVFCVTMPLCLTVKGIFLFYPVIPFKLF